MADLETENDQMVLDLFVCLLMGGVKQGKRNELGTSISSQRYLYQF